MKKILIASIKANDANHDRLINFYKFLSKDFDIAIYDGNDLSDRENSLKILNKHAQQAIEIFVNEALHYHNIPYKYSDLKKSSFLKHILEESLLVWTRIQVYDYVIVQLSTFLLSIVFARPDLKIIYDCPTPFFEENFYSGKLNNLELKIISCIENAVLKRANATSYNWKNYYKILPKAKKEIIKKYVQINSGTLEKKEKAKKNSNNILFLGNLSGYWSNSTELEFLQNNSLVAIDIYSPTKEIKKNLKTLGTLAVERFDEIIPSFSFGLVTISNDPLRNKGFSAKILTYLSYGLPVLIPDSRSKQYNQFPHISYNKENFNKKISFFSKPDVWKKASDASYTWAQFHSWSKTLQVLRYILKYNAI